MIVDLLLDLVFGVLGLGLDLLPGTTLDPVDFFIDALGYLGDLNSPSASSQPSSSGSSSSPPTSSAQRFFSGSSD